MLAACGTIVEVNCQWTGTGYTCFVGRRNPKTRQVERCGRLTIGPREVRFHPRD